MATLADSLLPDGTSQAPTSSNEFGGISTVDIIALQADGPGAPLRFGNVVKGSERVQLNGRLLSSVDDYALDGPAGVVYLRVAQHPGDTLTVSYRYDPKGATSSASFEGVNGFQYNVLPGSLGLMAGLGVAERASDGSVLKSNLFGWNNSFKFGASGSLGGLFLYADRQRANNQAGLSLQRDAKPGDASTDAGKSQFLLQNFRENLFGGTLALDYQDISKNFSSFGSVKAAGYADSDVNRFSAERGLKRTGFALTGMKVGALTLTDSFHDIKDPSGGIQWRSMGIQIAGLKLNSSSQRVENGFQRFKDISEADRQQLEHERGMSRENFSGEFAQKAGKLSFTDSSVTDDGSKKSIVRRDATLDLGKYHLNFGTQDVAKDFTRFTSLTGAEQGQWNREAGMKRQWLAFSTATGKDSTFAFNETDLRGSTGKFAERDLAYTGKKWSLDRTELGSSRGFASLGSMQDAEADGNVRRIATMFGNDVAIKPTERGAFLAGAGIQRDATRFRIEPFKNFETKFQRIDYRGATGGGSLETESVTSAKFQANFRHQSFGKQFAEFSNLLDLEKTRLGQMPGLDRKDFDFAYQFGPSKKLNFSQLTANAAGAGGANRTKIDFAAKGLELNVASRQVGKGFDAQQLVDPENGLLAQFRGFTERDMHVKWTSIPSLKFEAFAQTATGIDGNSEGRRFNSESLDWNPDKRTHLSYDEVDQKNDDPLQTLFANSLRRLSFSRDMGHYGQFQYTDETIKFDGKNTTNPDSHRQFLAYEKKLDARTSFRTEQTRTEYSNGDKEDISSNTLSTELSKRVGVSVTDTKIDRKGMDQDQTKRNYGFWYDLGSGLRFNYGYARQLDGTAAGNMSSTVSLGKTGAPVTPDQAGAGAVQAANAGDWTIGGAYGVNRWDSSTAMRTQSFSNVAISTYKPLHFGPMQDVKFNFGFDSAADHYQWLKEDRNLGFSGKIGANQLGYSYRGQMAPTGDRAIDRTFIFQTDPSEKHWFRTNFMYKVRTLPQDQQVMIRDYSATARVMKNVEVTNLIQTNPEVVKSDALLGSVPQASRSNKWRIDYKSNSNTSFGGTWEELLNEQNKAQSTTGGLNLNLFQKSGSPLKLFYGLEEVRGNQAARLTERYSVQFDQRPGANQTFSLFLGNLSYARSVADGAKSQNWTMRMDYQIRF